MNLTDSIAPKSDQLEIWAAIPGYEGSYEVSTMGRVRCLERRDAIGRLRHAKLRRIVRQPSGHLVVALRKDMTRKDFGVHVLMLMAFVGPRPGKQDACYWNDIPDDNRLENLRWGTRSDNAHDAVRNGRNASARKTHCPEGHPYSNENTYVNPAGRRLCRTCRRIQKLARNEARKSAA